MMTLIKRFLFIFHLSFLLILKTKAHSFCLENDLFKDLMIADYVDKKLADTMPVTYNHLLEGGHINMPSARMGCEGEIAFGWASVPPYRLYNARLQLTPYIEITGNYRIFRHILDPVFGHLGFGELSDKGANIKLSFIKAKDSNYKLPSVAIGLQDFLGTKGFEAVYAVATQVFLKQNLEVSLGYGSKRLKGLFGGVNFMPFRQLPYHFLNTLTLSVEYDSTEYKNPQREKHPKGRKVKSPVNIGLKYRLWNMIDCSLALIRGTQTAFSVSGFYNLGKTKGLLPKTENPKLYKTPIDTQPIGYLRSEEALVSELAFKLKEKGFNLFKATLSYNRCQETILSLHIENCLHRHESFVRQHLNYLLSRIIPENVDFVTIVYEAEGFPIQQYTYSQHTLQAFRNGCIGEYELNVLTPSQEVVVQNPCNTRLLFKQNRKTMCLKIQPKIKTFFGSTNGKFKYSAGVNIGTSGFIANHYYYSALFGYTFDHNLHHVNDFDMLNPSQLLNVRTDVINYYKHKGLTIDELYIQRIWNMGCGLYGKIGIGYFSQMYGGITAQILLYPVSSHFALGLDGAIVRKRTVGGIGFSDKIRKLNGTTPSFHSFTGTQVFLDSYYNIDSLDLSFKTSIGKFLANDVGSRFEMTKYFSSGMRLTLWTTVTNAKDRINGKTYYDKGFMFAIPLDIFYQCSSRSFWKYGLSAWLRDCGYRTQTGMDLYTLINEHRQ